MGPLPKREKHRVWIPTCFLLALWLADYRRTDKPLKGRKYLSLDSPGAKLEEDEGEKEVAEDKEQEGRR